MSIGKPKKIAFIGCSHFAAHEVPCQSKNNWTYQLYKKYSHHQYRNYSGGGKGIEHFQWALIDAKEWGADIVFLNRTYCGRWHYLAELSESGVIGFNFESQEKNAEPNWEELWCTSQYIWGNVHTGTSNVAKDQMTGKMYTTSSIVGEFFKNVVAPSETRRQYEVSWYSNVTKLYNFEHIFLIDWSQTSHTKTPIELHDDHVVTSNVNDTAVVEWLLKRFNASGESQGPRPLWSVGATISKDDNHLTQLGNQILLDEYILANHNVIKALTS